MKNKAVKPQIKRINKSCAYFPCHKGLQDCTFCYCPFYPCLNDKLGKYSFSRKASSYIWSCLNCVWIHKKQVADSILKPVRGGKINPCNFNRKPQANNTGIIILSHGSRIKQANATVSRLIKEIKSKGGPKLIEPSYLQLCSPDFHASVKKIVEKGYKKIVVVPFFLFTGNHVSRDIPREIMKEAKLYKDVQFVYARNIGHDSRLSDIVFDCIKEAL